MSACLIFTPLATAEIVEAYAWYDQPNIDKAEDFLADLERVERFIRLNPALYPRWRARFIGPTWAASLTRCSMSSTVRRSACCRASNSGVIPSQRCKAPLEIRLHG